MAQYTPDVILLYTVQLMKDHLPLGEWINVSAAINTYTFNLATSVPALANFSANIHHRFSAKVRAFNVIGYSEASSDGVLIVAGGVSTGKIFRGSDCSHSANLLTFGNFESDTVFVPIFSTKLPRKIAPLDPLKHIWYTFGGKVVPLQSSDLAVHGLTGFKLGAGENLQTIVRTLPGRSYTLTFDSTRFNFTSNDQAAVDIVISNRLATASDKLLQIFTDFVTISEQHLNENNWKTWSTTFIAVGTLTVIHFNVFTPSCEVVIDAISLKACISDPPSQASTQLFSIFWRGLPAAYISHYEWAIIKGPEHPSSVDITAGNIAANKYIIPFTSAGLDTKIFNKVVSFVPLTTYFFAVRACYPYPANCFDPVISDSLAIDNVAPKANFIEVAYAEKSKNILDITAFWQHFEEMEIVNGTATVVPVTLYSWTMAPHQQGDHAYLAWQPIARPQYSDRRIAGQIWNTTGIYITSRQQVAILPSNRPLENLYFVVRAYSTEGCIGYGSVRAVALQTVPTVIKEVALNFNIENLNGHIYDSLDNFNDVDVTKASTALNAIWPLYAVRNTGDADWNDVLIGTYEWSVSTYPYWLSTNNEAVLYSGITKDSGIMLSNINLQDSMRYYVCIRIFSATTLAGSSLPTKLQASVDAWTSCSNGVTVDLQAPTAGKVFMGNFGTEGLPFQRSFHDISIIWSDFEAIEDLGSQGFSNTILFYELAIGTFPSSQNIMQRTNVGDQTNYLVSNSSTLFKVSQAGSKFYATVWAQDRAGWQTVAYSTEVVIDDTAPIAGFVFDSNFFYNRYQSDALTLHAVWNGFSDAESGISHFEWAAGTHSGSTDIVAWRLSDSYTNSMYILTTPLALGERVFISVKAYNNAGLYTIVSSAGLMIDFTLPNMGILHDGPLTNKSQDIDYQISRDQLSAHWAYFNDPESGIMSYTWGAGTAKDLDDIVEFMNVGWSTAVTANNLILHDGLKVYITLKVCNHANLCVKSYSDGVMIDGSPPTAGIVQDGLAGFDAIYSASATIHALHWFGFRDMHSPIHYFEWCVGRAKFTCDEIAWIKVYLNEQAFGSRSDNASLWNSSLLYSGVRATNYAGQSITAWSNGVRLDCTPLDLTDAQFKLDHVGSIVIAIKDHLGGIDDYYPKLGFQPFSSILRASWQARDLESGVHHAIWSVRVHHDIGSQPVDGYYVTSSTEAIKADVILYDGDEYFLTLAVCNGAVKRNLKNIYI